MEKNNKFWYSESQGTRDFEILSRYNKIISYFEDNPKRITEKNIEKLSVLYDNDVVLKNDMRLRKRLFNVLNKGEYNSPKGIIDKINRNLRGDFESKLFFLLNGGNL